MAMLGLEPNSPEGDVEAAGVEHLSHVEHGDDVPLRCRRQAHGVPLSRPPVLEKNPFPAETTMGYCGQ